MLTLSQGDQKREIAQSLTQRAREAFIYLGYPDWCEIKYEGHLGSVVEKSHLRRSTDGITAFIDAGKFDTASHVARTTLYSVAIADFLKMNAPIFHQGREKLVVAAANHDTGKLHPNLIHLVDRYDLTPEEIITMREHVNYGALYPGNPDIREIIGLHHNWQNNSYRAGNITEKALKKAGVVLASKLLEIPDFLDACGRKNAKSNGNGNRNPKELLLKEFGKLPIKYEGEEFPNINITGGDLIESLYDKGIFGREPINPFPTEYSFILRDNQVDQFMERQMARSREIVMERKIAKYLEHEREFNHMSERLKSDWSLNGLVEKPVLATRLLGLKFKQYRFRC